MTKQEVEDWKTNIDAMSHVDMARLWRFAPIGDQIFDTRLPLFDYFITRFRAFGGMTTEISKQIGS